MKEIVEMTARLVWGSRLAYARKWSFLGLFVLSFAASTGILAKLDLLPNGSFTPPNVLGTVASDLKNSSTSSLAATSTQPPRMEVKIEEPVSIEIEAIALATSIANPVSTSISTLDSLLLKGAVRYPTSAKLGEDGNVVIFGHSSYLPVVKNPAYKAFNGIQKLQRGDTIVVSSAGVAYTYAVRDVSEESATANTAIPLSGMGRVLTLVTCDSFGSKSDRFIVTADFVESHLLGA